MLGLSVDCIGSRSVDKPLRCSRVADSKHKSKYPERALKLNKWRSDEIELMYRLLNEGVAVTDIADQLGRTIPSVKGRIQYGLQTKEQRERTRDRLRRRYKRKRVHENAQIIESGRPSKDALLERDRRYAAPVRDLTGLLLGDPRVGYAALDVRA